MIMKVYAAFLVVCFFAYCQGADKNYLEYCSKDDKCLGDTQCLEMRKGCTYGICMCPLGKVRDGTGNNCKDANKPKLIGDDCTSVSDCVTSYHASCKDGKCTCDSGYVAHEGKTVCAIYLGDACTSSCPAANSECKNSKCVCQAGYKQYGENMCSTYPVESDCSNGEKCHGYLECKSNKCSCKNTATITYKVVMTGPQKDCVNDKATTGIKEGEVCTEDFSTTTAKVCGKNLGCEQCTNENKYVCMQSGSVMVKAGVVTVLAIIMALLNF